jgi:hypothetical protein
MNSWDVSLGGRSMYSRIPIAQPPDASGRRYRLTGIPARRAPDLECPVRLVAQDQVKSKRSCSLASVAGALHVRGRQLL